MASKKDKSLSTKRKAFRTRPWPNLPQPLLKLLARKPNLLQQISYPGTTKSLTTPTRRCNGGKHPRWPQLHDLDGPNRWCSLSKTRPHFINIYFSPEFDRSWYYLSRVSLPYRRFTPLPHFVGCSRGSLVTRGPDPSDFHIFQVSLRGHEKLTQWDVNIPFKFVAQNSSATSSNSMVVVTGVPSPAFVVYKSSQKERSWIKYECNTIDPYDAKSQSMQFTNIIGFAGKFYALSLQGALAVMEEVHSRLLITAIGKNRAVPSVDARYFKEHLLESDGEILLVFLMYQKTLFVVDQVEVFRLDFPRLTWVKLESLQERALFLENECCFWVNSRLVGCRGNCVYFTQSANDEEWCTCDMESGCILPGLEATSPPWNEPMLEE